MGAADSVPSIRPKECQNLHLISQFLLGCNTGRNGTLFVQLTMLRDSEKRRILLLPEPCTTTVSTPFKVLDFAT